MIRLVCSAFMAILSVTLSADSFVTCPERRRIILGHGWDLLAATTEDVYRNRMKFAGAGLDGILMPVDGIDGQGNAFCGRDLLAKRKLRDADFSASCKQIRECLACPGLKESLALSLWSAPERMAWDNDADWKSFAENAAVFARMIRSCGFKGFAIDHEDYHKTRQFRYRPGDGDPDYTTTAKLARKRGAEVFAAIFREYPDVRILSFWFFTEKRWAVRSSDPASVAAAMGDLWTSFLNGMLDVMPPTVRLIEGNEEAGYRADVAKNAFRSGGWETLGGVLPLIAPENRAKYRAALSLGFGQYPDMYVNPEGNEWYFGPLGGSRMAKLASNLLGAALIADEYVWVYGEQGTWIDWDRKYTRSLKRPRWETLLPGLTRSLRAAAGDFAPFRKAIQSGRLANRISESAKVVVAKADDCKVRKAAVEPGDLVVVRAVVRGTRPLVNVAWQKGEKWRWDLGNNYLAAPQGSDPLARREFMGCFVAPEDVDAVGMTFEGEVRGNTPVEFEDVGIYICKHKEKEVMK